jgi:hypothetical protein
MIYRQLAVVLFLSALAGVTVFQIIDVVFS